MSRNTFVVWGLPLVLVLSLVPNIAAGFGHAPAVLTGLVALLGVWVVTWLRLGKIGLRHEFSILAVVPFVPEVFRASGAPWPEGGLPPPMVWLLILFWFMAGALAILCLKNERSQDGSPYDGTFVLLGTLTAAMVAIESFHLLYPAV